MSIRYGSRSRPGPRVSTWLNSLVSGSVVTPAAYFAGGTYASYANVATIDKFAFSDDSRTTLSIGLTVVTLGLAGMANSGEL